MSSSIQHIFHSIYEHGVRKLFPGYFSLVMATGIVSIAAFLQEMMTIATGLLYLNILIYIVLWILFILRLFLCPRELGLDLIDHAKGPGFFTIVAGTGVLGRQVFMQLHNIQITTILFILASILWLIIIYTFFTAITIKKEKPVLGEGINGAWLLSIVATQSVAILGTDIAGTLEAGTGQDALFFGMLVMFLIGCMLYIMVITLIFYRFSFFRLKPEDLTGPYWINMGAVAITTLAGATFLRSEGALSLIIELHIFLKGFTLFFWSIGTWWIPLLLILGFWRHVVKNVPWPWFQEGYDPSYWGLVFPLGMYTTCTWNLAIALDIPFLFAIPRYFIYLAYAGWIAIFIGMMQVLLKEIFFKTTSTISTSK